ncbi:hypothetical protein [Rosistilla carotiformis]|nr:hypothetical protein [Rosistilla carotiformis]
MNNSSNDATFSPLSEEGDGERVRTAISSTGLKAGFHEARLDNHPVGYAVVVEDMKSKHQVVATASVLVEIINEANGDISRFLDLCRERKLEVILPPDTE